MKPVNTWRQITSYTALTYGICAFLTTFLLLVAVRQTDSPEAFNYVFIEQQWLLPFFLATGTLSYIIFTITKIYTAKDVKRASNKALQDNHLLHSENEEITKTCEEAIKRLHALKKADHNDKIKLLQEALKKDEQKQENNTRN